MIELAVIIGAQLTLLFSIFAIKLYVGYVGRPDVLSGRYVHDDNDAPRSSSEAVGPFDATLTGSNRPKKRLLGPERDAIPRRWAQSGQIRWIWQPIASALFHHQQPNPILRAAKGPPPPPAHSDQVQQPLRQAAAPTGSPIVPNVTRSQTPRSPAVPPGIRIYAVGDIHGRADLLRALLERIDSDRARRPVARPILVFIGDYIDRGPSSKEVLDILLACRSNIESVFLKGNHEIFISRFVKDPAVLEEWRLCGGLETLVSYGLKPTFSPNEFERTKLSHKLARAMSASHLEFLDSLQLSFQCGDYLFVHAGIRPGVPLSEQEEKDLLWIREDFLSCEQPFGVFVVHGHTPVLAPDMRSNRLNIDTGAFATGRLTCVMIEGSTIVPLSTEAEDRRSSPTPA